MCSLSLIFLGTITSILLLRFVMPILSIYHESSMTVISYPNGSHSGSLLGFSIAYLNKHLVISAPKYGVGKLFDYDILKNTDLKGILAPFGEDDNDKSYWLGAVIKSGSTFLVTCAPRSYKYWYQPYVITRGSCYTIRENTLKQIDDIPQNLIDYYSNFGLDTSGWSIEIDSEDTVFIGSPAISLGGTVKVYKNINYNPSVLQNTTKTMNFGYAIASGYFLSENEISYAISSTYGDYGEGMFTLLPLKFGYTIIRPKYNYSQNSGLLRGNHINLIDYLPGIAPSEFYYRNKTLLQNNDYNLDVESFYLRTFAKDYHLYKGWHCIWDLNFEEFNEEVLRLYGTEVGASYGAALCKVHLNGKRSSLIVGSPTFSENANQYDNGAVYVYVPKNGNEGFILKRIIIGQKSGSYFGFAIVSLGDIDGDQKDEVAIGAPYEDDLKGAVYIYSGSGLLSGASWLQRIQPEKYRSFGSSLVSMDNCFENGCNELAVGAPFSERVFILKCNNYITLNLSAIFPNLQRHGPKWYLLVHLCEVISTPGMRYAVSGQVRTNETFFNFTTCIKVDLPKKHKTINTKISIRVELMHPDASLQKKDGTFVFALDSKSFYCNNITVLTPLDGNYDTTIAYKISASLNDLPSLEYSSSRVLLSDRSNLEIQGELWAANCKSSTGRCMPILNVTLLSNISEPYIVGSDKVSFSLSVFNAGETAYTACVLMLVQGAHVLRNPYTCTRHDGNERLMCKSPIPIHTNNIWELGEIQIDTNSLTSNDENIIIQYVVYNHCNNEDGKREYERVFHLGYDETGIVVTGVSNPSDLVNLTSADLATEQALEHFYMITNNGSTHWVGVTCEVLLQKRNYLNYKVYILKGRTESCVLKDGESNITSICEIGDLQHNQLVNIIIHVEVLPKSSGDITWSKNVTITTQLAVILRGNRKVERITTTLSLLSKSVPVWIPVVAMLLALLIIFVIVFILHKKQYFQRKNKKELEDLKASIHRNNSGNQQEDS